MRVVGARVDIGGPRVIDQPLVLVVGVQFTGAAVMVIAAASRAERALLIARADALGSNTVLLNFNQGAMPHDMFMRTLRRFGEEVLPALQAHDVTSVPIA